MSSWCPMGQTPNVVWQTAELEGEGINQGPCEGYGEMIVYQHSCAKSGV